MRVLAVDVGIQVCGYVICKMDKLDIQLLKEGEIKPSRKVNLPGKLNYIFEILEQAIAEYKPDAMVVEKLYSHHRHPTTLGVLSQVKGVAALLAQRANLKFFEYAPTRARQSFLGKGSANSEQVKKMAENIMGREFKSIHTADAFSLVVALSHDIKLERLQF